MDALILTGKPLSLEDVYSVAYGNRQVKISDDAEERVKKSSSNSLSLFQPTPRLRP